MPTEHFHRDESSGTGTGCMGCLMGLLISFVVLVCLPVYRFFAYLLHWPKKEEGEGVSEPQKPQQSAGDGKIFGADEGEYVEFEEIKTDESHEI